MIMASTTARGEGSIAMSAERKALLRRLALQEASRRSNGAEGSSGPGEQVDTSNGEDKEALVRVLEEERARNDHEWKVVREELARLRPPEGDAKMGSREAKALQLAKLDFDIRTMEDDLEELPPAQTTLVHEVRIRAVLADAVSQLEEALHVLRTQVEDEKNARDRQRRMLDDLKEVAVGLKQRRAKIESKSKEMDINVIIRWVLRVMFRECVAKGPNSKSSNLEKKVKDANAALKQLLRAVTASSDYAILDYSGSRTSMDFRLLVDVSERGQWGS